MSDDIDQSDRSALDDFALAPTDGNVPLCGGCRNQGHCRLGIYDVAYEDLDRVTVQAACDPSYRGGPTVAHGGWIAAVFDDALAHAVLRDNPCVVTQNLTVSYRRPVPVSTPLAIEANVRNRSGRTWAVEAQMFLDNAARPVLATASADFVARTSDYYERHRRWMEDTGSRCET
ncbi:PaaI family thioesterase [Rhodococcus pyridinivorans]|uniref:PaaI family thioesterase n=1 Tax=Rhodococcus pyridinivorans TaxID=103816 RepID=UPI001E3DEAB5|nr:PaaI family thioesterase [Rhodococcus pyridinivorans]MCD5422873.1 PaaI family thioesterase [Rhodococcus pyridinivorans]